MKLQEMEPTMSNKVFDFYGLYTRISENEKFRYAESKVVAYYKDVSQELVMANAVLKAQIETMIGINQRNAQNEEEMKAKVRKEKNKKERIKH